MKTLKEIEKEFDEKFIGRLPNGYKRVFNWREMSEFNPKDVKQFYRRAFAELMEEMVGEDIDITPEIYFNDNTGEAFNYNQAKAEIRERIKKMLE